MSNSFTSSAAEAWKDLKYVIWGPQGLNDDEAKLAGSHRARPNRSLGRDRLDVQLPQLVVERFLRAGFRKSCPVCSGTDATMASRSCPLPFAISCTPTTHFTLPIPKEIVITGYLTPTLHHLERSATPETASRRTPCRHRETANFHGGRPGKYW